jgi:hypothetical protein
MPPSFFATTQELIKTNMETLYGGQSHDMCKHFSCRNYASPRMFSVCCARRSKEHKIVAQATGATSPRHSAHLPRYRLRQPGIPTDAHRYTHAVVCNGKKRAKRDGRQAATGRKHPQQPGENTHAHIKLKRVRGLPSLRVDFGLEPSLDNRATELYKKCNIHGSSQQHPRLKRKVLLATAQASNTHGSRQQHPRPGLATAQASNIHDSSRQLDQVS